MAETAQTAGEGRGGGGGGRGGGGRGGSGQAALPPIQHCPRCNGRHRSNQRCWTPCPWCHAVHHRSVSCNGPGPQPSLPPATLGYGGLPAQETSPWYHFGRGMASQMAGGAGFGPSLTMGGAGSPPPFPPGVVPSHSGVASSQRGSFAPKPAKAKEGDPAGSLPAGGDAPAKTGGRRRKHRGGRGKRKRTAAGVDAEMKDLEEKVQQEEEGRDAPPLKKVRGEGEGEEAAAAATGGQPPANRQERRAGLAARTAHLERLMRYVPEEVAHQALLAQAADENAAARREQAAAAAEEHARQLQGANNNAVVEPVQDDYEAEEERLDEHSGLGRVLGRGFAVQGAAMRREMQDRLDEAAQLQLPGDDNDFM